MAKWREFDGEQWTSRLTNGSPAEHAFPRFVCVWPLNRSQWMVFVFAAIVGLAVWLPTMALQPAYERGVHDANGSPLFLPLMLIAAFVLGAVFYRNWQVVALAFLLPQFVLAPWTAPRGDNDGLWVLILPLLIVLFVIEQALAALAGTAVTWLRQRRTADAARPSA
jgi:hypothetical protein